MDSFNRDCTIAGVSFPLKSAIQRKAYDESDAKTTVRQEAILTLMANDPEITLDEIAKEIGVGTPSVDREIVQMSELFQRNKSMLLKHIIFPRFVLGLAEESEGQ